MTSDAVVVTGSDSSTGPPVPVVEPSLPCLMNEVQGLAKLSLEVHILSAVREQIGLET